MKKHLEIIKKKELYKYKENEITKEKNSIIEGIKKKDKNEK